MIRRSEPSSLLALGYAAGALGADDVIAVSAPGMAPERELGDFATVMMDSGDGWRHEVESLLSEAECTRLSSCVVDQAIVIDVSR